MKTEAERAAEARHAAAENTAERLKFAAAAAAAWARGNFETVTAAEAADFGWESEAATAQIFESEGWAAIWNAAADAIEFCDATGAGWFLTPATGELARA